MPVHTSESPVTGSIRSSPTAGVVWIISPSVKASSIHGVGRIGWPKGSIITVYGGGGSGQSLTLSIPVFSKDAFLSAENMLKYSTQLGRRFPTGEYLILTSPIHACWYARDILKHPWPQGELLISTDGKASFYYACDVLEGPFPAGENAISEHSMYSFWYSRDILKTRWVKGEKAIKAAGSIYQDYLNHFNIKQRTLFEKIVDFFTLM